VASAFAIEKMASLSTAFGFAWPRFFATGYVGASFVATNDLFLGHRDILDFFHFFASLVFFKARQQCPFILFSRPSRRISLLTSAMLDHSIDPREFLTLQ